MKRTQEKGSKATPLSIINMKKAIESRSAGRRHRTPGDENRPCTSSSGTPLSSKITTRRKDAEKVTPLLTSSKVNRLGRPITPTTTPCRGTPRMEKAVLFEFNDDLFLSGGKKNAGIVVTQTSTVQVDGTPSGPYSSVLNRSRSASCITRNNRGNKLRRSASEVRIIPDQETSKGANDGEVSRIAVGVRIRPLHPREYGNTLSVDGCELKIASDLGSEMKFSYDHTFTSSGPDASSQETVYLTMVKPLLDNVFEGYNACLFAYGQTGSGKTYSMMGPDTEVDEITEHTGVIPRFCRELIERCNSREDIAEGIHVSTSVEISYLEVYNEKIRDLLVPAGSAPLRVREHPVYGPYVADLSKHTVNTFNDIKHWITEGNKKRIVAATEMNESSSRSHSLFMVTLTQSSIQNKGGGTWTHEQIRRSQMNLVDLAGSERISHSSVSSDRLREGVSINKSLLTLGKVISALIENRSFVPYRESVLTWLLKESLGGNSRTSMLATVSPCNTHLDETLATLRYASQARAIVNTVRINESPQDKIIRELQAEVEHLKELNSTLELKGVTPSKKMVKVDNEEVAKMKDQVKDLEGVVRDLKVKLDESSKKAMENQNRADAAEKKVESLQWESQERKMLEKEIEEWRSKAASGESDRCEWSSKLASLERHYRSRVESLEREVMSWKERLIAKEKREADWRQKVEKAEAQCKESQKVLDLSVEEKERVAQRAESVQLELDNWKAQAQNLTFDVQELSAKNEETKRELALLGEANENLKKDKEEMEKRLRDNESTLKEALSKVEQEERFIAQLKDKYAQLENQLLSERQERELLEQSVHALTNQLDSCSTKTLFHLSTSVQVQTGIDAENDEDSEDSNSELIQIKKEMAKLKKKLISKIGKYEVLKEKANRVDALEEKLNQMTSEKMKLDIELKNMVESLRESDDTVVHYKESCAEYENQYEILRQEFEKVNAELKSKSVAPIEIEEMSSLRESLERASEKLKEKEELISSLKNQVSFCDELKSQLVSLKEEKDAVNGSLKEALDGAKRCEETIKALTEEKNNLLSEMEEVKKILKEEVQEKAFLKEINEQFEQHFNEKDRSDEVRQLNELVLELKNELSATKEKLNEINSTKESSDKVDLEMALNETKRLLNERELEAERYKNECDNMASELELLKELEEKYQERVESSFKEREDSEAKMIAERDEWKGKIKELHEKICQLVTEREQLLAKSASTSANNPDLVQINTQNNLYEQKVCELQTKLDQKTSLIMELEKLNSRLKEDLVIANSQVAELFKNVTDLTKQVGEVVERAALANAYNACETNSAEVDLCKTPKAEVEPSVVKEQLQELRTKYKHLNSKYGDTLLKNKELEDMLKEKDIRLVDLHGQLIHVEKMLQDEIQNKISYIKKCEEKHLQNPEESTDSSVIKEELSRKKKRIEKMKSRIDKLEDLLISTMRTASEKKNHAILRQEYAQVFDCMMEHSYLFHWEYLLKKARTYAHKYHIPYEFESHDNAIATVRHLTLNARSYWFRMDLVAWFEKIEKEDKWEKSMDQDIQWEVDLMGYYEDNSNNASSQCPVEQESCKEVILCCKPDYICPELWKRTIVQRHLNGLKEDSHSLLLYFNKTQNQNILDFLRCIENLISQLELELRQAST